MEARALPLQQVGANTLYARAELPMYQEHLFSPACGYGAMLPCMPYPAMALAPMVAPCAPLQPLPPLPPQQPPQQVVASAPLAPSSTASEATLAKTKVVAAGAAKKAKVTKGKEHEYSLDDFRQMCRIYLEHGQAEKTASKFEHGDKAVSSLKRYVKDIKNDKSLVRDTPEATLAARLAHIDTIDFYAKGNKELCEKTLFSEHELNLFTEALLIYSDMGWPLHYKQIRVMMEHVAAKEWRAPRSVSLSYVRKFVLRRPELAACKTSNIDPIRTRKASAKVCARLLMSFCAVSACVLSYSTDVLTAHYIIFVTCEWYVPMNRTDD